MSTSGRPERVRALRGATTAGANEADAIADATVELLEAMLGRNDARPEDLISALFTSTPDLDAGFPAAAARRLGLRALPLLCATEMEVPGAPARCIRILLHLYSARSPEQLKHVYLRGARGLRSDLGE